jgi:hypothetical protein
LRLVTALAIGGAATLALLPASCTTKEPSNETYFEQTIAPVLTTSCVRTNTGAGCHVADAKGNAFGNLDLSSYAGINARRDLLQNYGPYGRPALLVKNIPPVEISLQFYDGTCETPPPGSAVEGGASAGNPDGGVCAATGASCASTSSCCAGLECVAATAELTTDIKHTGGPILDPTASAYQVLARWIGNGASENNAGPPPASTYRLPCTDTIGTAPGFTAAVAGTDPTTSDFAVFKSQVNPLFQSTCSAGNCHGTTVNDLYLTCGSTPEEIRWNYFAAQVYLAQTPEQSELLRRPLNPGAGGSFHEGGIIFQSPSDSGYEALLAWATAHGPPVLPTTGTCGPDTPAACASFSFFAHRVQPVLAKKGCMMLQCHSAAMFHDYRLRGGSAGSFSFSATERNYTFSIGQIALESDDVMASRLVRKNVFRPELSLSGKQVGIAHRGGPLFEDFPGADANGSLCASGAGPDGGPYDYDNDPIDSIPALCMIQEWHRRERADRNPTPLSAIAYVSRTIPPAPDRPQDFDVYSGGAQLHLTLATLTAGALTLGADTVMNTACGLDPANADIRRPSVSWDGTTIAFAARNSASDPLEIYTMSSTGTNCVQHAAIDAGPTTGNSLLIHNFDPVFAPPDSNGNANILVFASTRGNLSTTSGVYDYTGPQRTPADPSKPNADLYVYEPDPSSTTGGYRIRQQTFLLDMERYPTFMQDGRLVFTTEKREPAFYELALRRQNLDGSDYHPLFSQRGSIGYNEAREPVELADKDFAAIFGDEGTPHGGGALGIINRSIGLDFTSTNPADYPVDPTVINPASQSAPEPSFFLSSLSFPDPSASGHAGAPTTGVYAHPSALPDGDLLVSYGAATDAGTFGGDYDLYVFNRTTNARALLVGNAGTAEVDAVAVYGRVPKGIFAPTGDEPNGFTSIHPGAPEADINILDMPVIASLLFQNTPTGRVIEDFTTFDLYEDLPPLTTETSMANANPSFVAKDQYGEVYVRRRLLGHVPLQQDGSTHFVTFGGLPLVIDLPATTISTANKLPRFQREEIEFSPGEYAHQGFQRQFFDNLCGLCHSSISGRAVDNAVAPDILTEASDTLSHGQTAIELRVPASQRPAPIGPPANP